MDWNERRQIERTTDFWGSRERKKHNATSPQEISSNGPKTPTDTKPKQNLKPAFKGPWKLNEVNAQKLHAKDEKDTAKNQIRKQINISANPKCDFTTRRELAEKTLGEIYRQSFLPKPALTLDLLKEIITNYSHNPRYLQKDPELRRLASLVLAYGILEPSLQEFFMNKTKADGSPSRLAEAINSMT